MERTKRDILKVAVLSQDNGGAYIDKVLDSATKRRVVKSTGDAIDELLISAVYHADSRKEIMRNFEYAVSQLQKAKIAIDEFTGIKDEELVS